MTLRAACAVALFGAFAPLSAIAQGVTAILEPVQSVDIRTSLVGILERVDVAEGATVAQGAPLAQLQSRTQSQRVALAQVVADADGRELRAKTQMEQAQALFERVQAARARGAAQSWEVEQAQKAVDLAKADLQIAQEGQIQARAQLALEQAMLADYTLRAPFPGVVLEVQAEAGTYVDAQAVVLKLAQLDALEATAFVPLEWLDRMTVGQSLEAEVEGAAIQTAAVQVTTIDPRIDPASRTVRIRVALDNADRAFRPGATLILRAP